MRSPKTLELLLAFCSQVVKECTSHTSHVPAWEDSKLQKDTLPGLRMSECHCPVSRGWSETHHRWGIRGPPGEAGHLQLLSGEEVRPEQGQAQNNHEGYTPEVRRQWFWGVIFNACTLPSCKRGPNPLLAHTSLSLHVYIFPWTIMP